MLENKISVFVKSILCMISLSFTVECSIIPINSEDVNPLGDDNVSGFSSCKCGIPGNPNTLHRIVGGGPASINEHPWTVGITRGSEPFCGGSLINSRYIITAAHCVEDELLQDVSVVIGEQDYGSAADGANPRRYRIDKIIIHEGYKANRGFVDNDIALLRLSESISLGNANIPICIPASNNINFSGLIGTVAGWGRTSEDVRDDSYNLMKVEVPILSNLQCNTTPSHYAGRISENMLCAGLFETGGKDSCQGDSGSPLTVTLNGNNGGRQTLVGIVSWGLGCARPYAPGVYTRVGRYADWIMNNVKDADWCLK